MANSRLKIIFDLLTKDKLSPDLKRATSESRKLNKSVANVSGNFKNISASSRNVARGLKVFAAAAVAAAAAFAGSKIIQIAQEQEDAINAMNTALKRSGEFSEDASQGVQEWSDAVEAASTSSSAAILNSFALAKSFGFSAKQARVATQAALELSAAAGISLDEATRRVGRTISGSIEDVSKFADGIQDLTKEQLKSGEAATVLADSLAGTALSKVNTFSGATIQLGNQFNNLLVAIGNIIIKSPKIINLVKNMGKGFIALTKSIKKNAGEIQKFISEAFDTINDFIGFFQQQIVAFDIAFASFLQSAVEGILEFTRLLSGLPGMEKLNKDLEKFNVNLLNAMSALGKEADTLDQKLEESFKDKTIKTKIELDKIDVGAGVSTLELKLTDQFQKLALSGIAKGAQGAQALVAGLAGTLTEQFLPGLGGAVSEIVGLLAQGPEAVEKTVDQFTQALPLIFENIVTSLPVLIERLIVGLVDAFVRISERADIIVQAFAEGMIRASPRIAIALALQMPRVGLALAKSMPNAAGAFIDSLVDGADDFIDALIEGIKEAFEKLIKSIVPSGGGLLGGIGGSLLGGVLGGPLGSAFGGFFGGGGGSNPVSSVASSFGFAEGGVVPSGFPNDTFPARLTSGEGIIRSDLNARLENFLDNQGGPGDMILSQILTELRRPQSASATIELDQRTFGTILLELSRNNVRTVA